MVPSDLQIPVQRAETWWQKQKNFILMYPDIDVNLRLESMGTDILRDEGLLRQTREGFRRNDEGFYHCLLSIGMNLLGTHFTAFSLVSSHGTRVSKCFVTFGTFIWFLSAMNPLVFYQKTLPFEF